MSAWSAHRQVSVVLGFLVLLILLFLGLYLASQKSPSCSDGIFNGEELGVDCGGACQAVCSSETTEPIVIWARSFPVRGGLYDLAALVENPNPFGLGSFSYEFQVFDDKNIPIKEVRASTYLNPRERMVIFTPAVDLGHRIPEGVFLKTLGTNAWQREVSVLKPDIKIEDREVSSGLIEGEKAKVSATLVNRSLFPSGIIEAFAVVQGEGGQVLGVSRTTTASVLAGDKTQVVFTWPEPFTEEPSGVGVIVRTKLVE